MECTGAVSGYVKGGSRSLGRNIRNHLQCELLKVLRVRTERSGLQASKQFR